MFLDLKVLVEKQSHSCFSNSGHLTAGDVFGDLLKLEANPLRVPCQIYDLFPLMFTVARSSLISIDFPKELFERF